MDEDGFGQAAPLGGDDLFDDEAQEHEEIPQKDDVKISVTDCRKEGSDWKYDIEVGVAQTCV